MKKVAFLTNSMGGGGAERIVATLGKYFSQDEEMKSEMILFEKNDFYDPGKGVSVNYIADYRGDESPLVKLAVLPFLAWKLKRYIGKNNIQVVQSHLYRANYINILAKMMGSKHESQIVNHDNFFRGYTTSFIGRQKLRLVKFFYSRADKIIAISEDMKEGMEELLGRRVKKINNPYDIQMMKERSTEGAEDLKRDKKYIVSVGRLIPLKRVEDILEGFSYIAKKYSEYDLLILGTGPEEEKLKELCSIFGIKDRVRFMGRVDNPFKYLKRSHIFAMASESEGFPNVLIEAMACGCQVVAADCISGPREIIAPELSSRVEQVTHGKHGILFPVGDVEGLSFAMETLIKSKIEFNVEERASQFEGDIIMKRYKEVLMDG